MDKFSPNQFAWDVQFSKVVRILDRVSTTSGSEVYVVRFPDGSKMARAHYHLEKRP